MKTECLLKPQDVAELCQVSPKTVLRAIRSGHLRASNLGSKNAYRIRRVDMERWIDSRRVVPATLVTQTNEPISLQREILAIKPSDSDMLTLG